MDIHSCPALLIPGQTTYSRKGVKYLFDGIRTSPFLSISFEDYNADTLSLNMNNLSISGAQEKYSAVLDGGVIRLIKDGERGTYILKPAPMVKLTDRREIPANEHLTMQIASQVYGIKTAQCGLCFDTDKRPVYITKRYDVLPDGTRLRQEDFASILGLSIDKGGEDFKYSGSYTDIANCIKKTVSASTVALEQFYKLVIFNYIYANGDAHLKNFSILTTGKEKLLAPAYDLINTAMHIGGDDIGLQQGFGVDFEKSDTYARTGHPCRKDFEHFATIIGINTSRASRVLDTFSTFPVAVDNLIAQSYLSTEKHKRNYRRIIEERRSRFNRD